MLWPSVWHVTPARNLVNLGERNTINYNETFFSSDRKGVNTASNKCSVKCYLAVLQRCSVVTVWDCDAMHRSPAAGCGYPLTSEECSCVATVCYYPLTSDICSCVGGHHGQHGHHVQHGQHGQHGHHGQHAASQHNGQHSEHNCQHDQHWQQLADDTDGNKVREAAKFGHYSFGAVIWPFLSCFPHCPSA